MNIFHLFYEQYKLVRIIKTFDIDLYHNIIQKVN